MTGVRHIQYAGGPRPTTSKVRMTRHPHKRKRRAAGTPTNRNPGDDTTIATIRCQACGDYRPHTQLNVHTRYRTFRSGRRPTTLAYHVTHCADRPACKEYATLAGALWHVGTPARGDDKRILRARAAATRGRTRPDITGTRWERFWGHVGAMAARCVLWRRRHRRT